MQNGFPVEHEKKQERRKAMQAATYLSAAEFKAQNFIRIKLEKKRGN